MKIAIVNRHYLENLGGSELQCDHIAKGLMERGHDVVYIAPSTSALPDYQSPYRVVHANLDGAAILQAALAEKPDIVYWRMNKYHFYTAAKGFAKAGIPVVFAISHINDVRTTSYRENPFSGIASFLKCVKQVALTTWNHRAFRYVSGVTSLSEDFINKLSVPRQTIVPDCVDAQGVPFSWPRPYVAWVASVKPQKQPEVYVRLAKALADTGVDFLMIGQIQSEDYKWIEREHEKTPNFHYLGKKTPQEVNGILAGSVMLVHTCKPEGFGNNFIQAWLQKKPTVSYAFDPANIITQNKLGGYANADWDVFLSQVKGLLENPSEREAAGLRAYEHATGRYDRTSTINALEPFLEEVARAA